jgi:hypothetical protein
MKKPLLQVAFALVLMALQASFLRFVGGGGFSLALALPCVVYLGLYAATAEGALAAAGVGYGLDLMAAGPAGLLTFLSVALFLASRVAGATFDVKSGRTFALASALGTLLVGVTAWLLTRYVSPAESAPGAGLLLRILVESVLTGAASPLVLFAMRRIDGLFDREEPGLLR